MVYREEGKRCEGEEAFEMSCEKVCLVRSGRLNGAFFQPLSEKGCRREGGRKGASRKKHDFGDLHDGCGFKNRRADADMMYEHQMQKQQALMERDRVAAVKAGKNGKEYAEDEQQSRTPS